jgi:hypothetical protein
MKTHVLRPPRNFAAADSVLGKDRSSFRKILHSRNYDALVVLKFAPQSNKINKQIWVSLKERSRHSSIKNKACERVEQEEDEGWSRPSGLHMAACHATGFSP